MKDGTVYHGAFSGGRPAPGVGKFVFKNGTVQNGEWVSQPSENEEEPAKLSWIPGALGRE